MCFYNETNPTENRGCTFVNKLFDELEWRPRCRNYIYGMNALFPFISKNLRQQQPSPLICVSILYFLRF
jgi:hypothetical protein